MQPGPIYAITDPELLPGDRLFTGVAAALRGGVRTVQYRDKNASALVRRSRATRLLALCNDFDAALLINDDAELAAEIGAHGVHLGQDDLSVRQARTLMGPDAIIGATCHASLTVAQQAVTDGADYVAFGRFFTSSTKPSAPPAPLHILNEARQSISRPVVAIGGVSLDNMDLLVSSGASSLAVCHSLFSQADIEKTAQALLARYLMLA